MSPSLDETAKQRPHERAKPCRRALTLLEMLITIGVLAAAASIVTPLFSDDSRLRVMAAAQIVASDIELAQVMTISLPNDPVIVRFEVDADRYWLAYAADPDTPIARADNGEPYLVVLGEGRARSAHGVTIAVTDMTQNTLAFDSTGALTTFATTPLIHLNNGSNVLTLSIAPMTGSISEVVAAEPAKEEEVPVK